MTQGFCLQKLLESCFIMEILWNGEAGHQNLRSMDTRRETKTGSKVKIAGIMTRKPEDERDEEEGQVENSEEHPL